MNVLEFLRSDTIVGLLERAAASAGVPLSVHHVARNQEGARVLGWGQCNACRHVQSLPGGGAACRLSRTTAANMALRQQRALPFICHLGFACVSAPLLPGEGCVMTLGPFCPMEEQRSLEGDIRAGLEALLQRDLEELPVSLEDIHRAPSAAIPAIAEWTIEAVRQAWAALQTSETEAAWEMPAVAAEEPVSRRSSGVSAGDGGDAGQVIAAALTGGDFSLARGYFQGELEEIGRSRGGKSIEVRRARVAALASSTLEGIARSGASASEGWSAYPDFVDALARAEADSDLLNAAMALFGFLRRTAFRQTAEVALPNYPELHALVSERLLKGVTLEEVADHLGETPSAISHRLKRKFGMSFSDYVGRLRIDRAKQLFRGTALRPSEVARRVGISDVSNFARLFRKVEGLSPAAYRKQFGKKQ